MTDYARCRKCGRRIATVPGYRVGLGVTLVHVWVHISFSGHIRRYIRHKPVPPEGK